MTKRAKTWMLVDDPARHYGGLGWKYGIKKAGRRGADC